MDELVKVTREELETFAVEAVEKNQAKVDEKIEALKEGLDEKLDELKDELVPKTKELCPNEAMGKMIQYQYARIKNPALFKNLDPQDETTAADGGTLVPTITRPEILRLIEKFGQARSRFRQIPMGKAAILTLPGKLAGATVARYSENATIADTKVTLTTYTLTAQKAAAIVAFTSELLEDEIVNLGAYVNEQLAEAFWEEEDGQMFAGTGSPHTGLFNASSTYGNEIKVTNAASITYDNLVDCSVGLRSWYLDGAGWKMHRTVYAAIAKLKDENGNPIVVDPGAVRREMFGYPIDLIEKAPNASTVTASMPLIILGNTNKNSFMGIKRELTMQILIEATIDSVSLATNDLTAIRVTKRDAFSVGIVGGYSTIKISD